MAIAHVNTAVSSATATSTTRNVTMPTFSPNDLVVVILTATAGSTATAGTFTAAAGWTEISPAGGLNVPSVSAVRLQCFYRLMQGGDPGSVDFTISVASGYRAIASSYSGVDLATPIDTQASSTGGANTSAVCPTITTTNDNEWILRVVACDDNESLSNGSITIRDSGSISTPGNGHAVGSGDEIQVTAGSTGTSTWTLGASEEWGTYTIAINPVLVSYELTGVTKRNATDTVVGDCECYLFKDNGDNTLTWLQQTTSDSVTGVWTFSGITDNDPNYLVVAWKDESPHIFDVSDRNLTPEETTTISTDLCLWSDVEKGEVSVDTDLRLRRFIDKCPDGAIPNTVFFGMNF